jgi:hypothetical protein
MVVKMKYIPILARLVPMLVIGFIVKRGVHGASHAIHLSHARYKSFQNKEIVSVRAYKTLVEVSARKLV